MYIHVPSVHRMLDPIQKRRGCESRNYRNVTRDGETDDDDKGSWCERERKRQIQPRKTGVREKRESGAAAVSSGLSPGTMQNSASNSKAVRQSATSLFGRESSRFFRGANRSLNPNERLRKKKKGNKKRILADRRTTPMRDSMDDRPRKSES